MLPAPPTTRLDFIQALRGIAAAAVVMFHARIWMAGALYLDLAHRAFDNAAAGVDLFFVIWLQSLPLPNLAHALLPFLPQPGRG